MRESSDRWTIVVLTCRDPETDFRRPLAEELHSLGHDVTYIFLKRRPVVSKLGSGNDGTNYSMPSFLNFMRRSFRAKPRLVVFNSTNLAFAGLSRLLRLIIGGFWIFDIHDDLLYGTKGRARLKAEFREKILMHGSDLLVHAAPTLIERFPNSRHLGNASSVVALPRQHKSYEKVLILASLDERMDFEFLAACAQSAPQLTFDIYGQISSNDPIIRSRLEKLVGTRPNLVYHGPYVNADLGAILQRYAVTLAPYVTSSALTRYIDPLRYYHCLNSGMEVLSTDIPKARDFGSLLHIVDQPAQVGQIIDGLARGSVATRNDGKNASRFNWQRRAQELIEIVRAEAKRVTS